MTTDYIKLASANRTSGTPQEYIISVPQHLRGKQFNLSYAYIPISFYNVNGTYQYIYFEETAGVMLTATLPKGNYNTSTIGNAVQTAMDDVSLGGYTYTVNIDPLTNKMTINSTGNFRIFNSTDKSTYPQNIHQMLGFESDTIGSFSSAHVAPDMINLNIIDSINITIGTSMGVESLNGYDSSLIIPVTENSLDYITYSPKNTFQQTVVFDKSVNTIQVKVRDSEFNILDLNGIDWYLILKRM